MTNRGVINNFNTYLYAVRYLNQTTIKNYTYEIKLFLEYLENNNLSEKYHAVNFTEYLKYRGANLKSKGTVNNYIKAVKIFYQFLLEERIIKTDYSETLESITPTYKIPYILNCYQLHCIFNQFTKHSETSYRDIAILETLYSTGCRVNELLNMKMYDYKIEASSVIGKNNCERLVIFNKLAIKRIEFYQSNRKVDSDLMFTNLNGVKLSAKYINKMIDEVCIKALIPFKVTAHTFRHTFATHIYEGGANIIQVKDLLGHQTVATTEIYAHIVGVEHLRKELQLKHPRW
jgi:integrase/recombinase XerD